MCAAVGALLGEQVQSTDAILLSGACTGNHGFSAPILALGACTSLCLSDTPATLAPGACTGLPPDILSSSEMPSILARGPLDIGKRTAAIQFDWAICVQAIPVSQPTVKSLQTAQDQGFRVLAKRLDGQSSYLLAFRNHETLEDLLLIALLPGEIDDEALGGAVGWRRVVARLRAISSRGRAAPRARASRFRSRRRQGSARACRVRGAACPWAPCVRPP